MLTYFATHSGEPMFAEEVFAYLFLTEVVIGVIVVIIALLKARKW